MSTSLSRYHSGYRWVVDLDLEEFFDRVSHDILMRRAAKRIDHKRVLKLIRSFLRAGVMENGQRTKGHRKAARYHRCYQT
jgi:RNA-directed DNA polymerase